MSMSKDAAKAAFLRLMATYGISWTNKVPDAAWRELQKVEKLLTEEEKRDLLLNRIGRDR